MSTPSKRKSEDITNSDSPSKDASNFDSAPKKRNYQKYSLQFKIKVIKEAKSNNNNRLTARTYDLDESLLRDWRKNEAKILKNLDSCTNQNPSLRTNTMRNHQCWVPVQPRMSHRRDMS